MAYILIERLKVDEVNALSVIDQCLSTRKLGAVATVFKTEGIATEIGNSILIDPSGSIVSTITNPKLENMVRDDLQVVLKQQRSVMQLYSFSESTAEVFLEVIQPPVSLSLQSLNRRLSFKPLLKHKK
ncbi:MAG: XdhC family protein [Cyanobacteria bacterium P01_G01_bin.39]